MRPHSPAVDARGACLGLVLVLSHATAAIAAGAAEAAASDADAGVAAAASSLATVTVTATRVPELAARVPAAISVVPGGDLRARGATDMASALALVSGVEAPSGGDAGPSSAVPALWGLHEFDAFLLVVDGVPSGGAFNPAITTLDFTDTQRVEVLKGAAPVMYGATSFVGVVNVIHYPAGEASNEAQLAYGTYGSLRGSMALALPGTARYQESLVVDGSSVGFADGRETAGGGHAFYRGALETSAGTLRIDANFNQVRDNPTSPVIRTGAYLTDLTPLNANFNPANARIDENKTHIALDWSQPTAWGTWETLASYAWSTITDIRGFLEPDLTGTGDTQDQDRSIEDGYLDTHLAFGREGLRWVAGIDALYGRGVQTTLNGTGVYTVPLDGLVVPPPTWALPVNEIGTLDDKRLFGGEYLQVDWQPAARWDVIAGVRMNETYERKISTDYTVPPPQTAYANVNQRVNRPTETLGVSWQPLAAAADALTLYADFRNAFKPAAVDFGPDYTPQLLEPEQAYSYEIGAKGATAGGRLAWQAEAFLLDFTNLVVPTESGALTNAGGERLKGVDLEARWQLTPALALLATAAYHDATYTNYLFFNGSANVNVAGNQLPLSPYLLAAAGVQLATTRGFNGNAVVRYVGRRYLDEENQAPVGGYTTFDASVGYAQGPWGVTLAGTNLSNQRPPVTASEFGSESFYLLPARMLWVRLGYAWR